MKRPKISAIAEALAPVMPSEESQRNVAHVLANMSAEQMHSLLAAHRGDAPSEPSDERKPRYQFLTAAELQQMERPAELIQEILHERSLAALFGAPGRGKSFLALDFALCVASGTPWCGHRQVQRGAVVYIAAEGASATLGSRIAAWQEFTGVADVDGIHFVTRPVLLADAADVECFILDAAAQTPEQPLLVIFDTLARCALGSDENSARDMGAIIAGCDRVRDKLGCCVLLIHHTNKSGESERGSTALRGAVDTLLFLKGSDARLELVCEKQKDAAPFADIHLRLKSCGDSAVLTAISSAAVDGDDLTAGELETLQSLAVSAPPEGLSSTRWMAVADKPERTFWRHRKRLDEKSYVARLTHRGYTHYTVSDAGQKILDSYCHDTAN